ncbi:MAG: UPF0280 family protein [Candidatus Omnitrophota bacterium]
MYKRRIYRNNTKNNPSLEKFELKYFESDLLFYTDTNLENIARRWLMFYHDQILQYCCENPEFRKSLAPLKLKGKLPLIIRRMLFASKQAHVGPMASVAGAIAEFVGKKLLAYSKTVIIENGGDIFIKTEKKRKVGLFAGMNSIYNRLYLNISPADTPCGICTSSSKIGHSLSFGKTEACVIIAKSAIIADCFATYIGNLIKSESDFSKALKIVKSHKSISGAIFITNSKLTAYGKLKLNVLDKHKLDW